MRMSESREKYSPRNKLTLIESDRGGTRDEGTIRQSSSFHTIIGMQNISVSGHCTRYSNAAQCTVLEK